MLDIAIDVTGAQLIAAEVRALPKQVDRALRRTINRTLTTGRARIARDVRAETGLRSKTVRARLKIIRATLTDLTGIIVVGAKRIPLYEFRARQTKRGVTYQIRRGVRVLLERAFIQDTPRRGRQVLKRAADPSRPSGLVARDPAFMRFGEPLTAILPDVLPSLQVDLTAVFTKNFDAELAFQRRRRG